MKTNFKKYINNFNKNSRPQRMKEMPNGMEMSLTLEENVVLPNLVIKKKAEPIVEIPIRKVTGNKRGPAQRSYRKTLPTNADGTYISVVIPSVICQSGTGTVVYPSVAILRAFGMYKDALVDTQVASYDGRLGILITHADKGSETEIGVLRKKVVYNGSDRYNISIAKQLREMLGITYKDAVSIQFIPERRNGRKLVEGACIFVYKGQEAKDEEPITKKKSLLQEALEIASTIKSTGEIPQVLKRKKVG